MRQTLAALVLTSVSALTPGVVSGQPARALTAADYARAERFLPAGTAPLVLGAGVRATWLPDGRFWYRTTRERGAESWLVDPRTGAKVACDLPACRTTPPPVDYARSPDGHYTAFIRDWNLWLRDTATNRERQLTTDGVTDFGYATDNAGWVSSDRPVLVWSPDSTQIATFQQDQRGVGEMHLVSTNVGHPKLTSWKYPLPGDAVVTTIQPVVIDVARATVVRIQTPPLQHRSSICDDVSCRGDEWTDVQWAADSKSLAVVSTSRDHRHEELLIADAVTGRARKVLEETVATFFEAGNGRANWRYLSASNQLLWFSQKDNWGHLYLHDATTGALTRQITRGEFNVTQLLRVDEQNGWLYFVGVGREAGRDPYFRHFYRASIDGRTVTRLSPADADHDIQLSPTGEFFVDVASTPATPPVAELRSADGRLVTTLETADISRLVSIGWRPPMSVTVKARDGVTTLYGLLYAPTTLDPSKKYPIVNRIYPGPQTGSVGSRSFSPARGDAQALAELGFMVVEIDGMGTPWRSKAFHDASYGNMGDNTIPDQVAGMRDLARRLPYIDLDRVGIYGHSGGGYATATAMLRYPDFFKVGVAQAGNHDNRNYEDDWAEKWQGLLTTNADGTTNYDNQANQLIAANLKGHLLLAHGTMDANVPPSSTLLLVDALIKANKDFDLLMLPNRDHGFGNEPYMVRRRWDYFVKYLLGLEPPREYQIGRSTP
ncbi:MAG: DPP IV N-terminal domain-containing protein [Vicinamibacterales bacterium]